VGRQPPRRLRRQRAASTGPGKAVLLAVMHSISCHGGSRGVLVLAARQAGPMEDAGGPSPRTPRRQAARAPHRARGVAQRLAWLCLAAARAYRCTRRAPGPCEPAPRSWGGGAVSVTSLHTQSARWSRRAGARGWVAGGLCDTCACGGARHSARQPLP
jgi:hypothetical protein